MPSFHTHVPRQSRFKPGAKSVFTLFREPILRSIFPIRPCCSGDSKLSEMKRNAPIASRQHYRTTSPYTEPKCLPTWLAASTGSLLEVTKWSCSPSTRTVRKESFFISVIIIHMAATRNHGCTSDSRAKRCPTVHGEYSRFTYILEAQI